MNSESVALQLNWYRVTLQILRCFNEVNLKALYTFGYCHRPVFSLGVSQHMHKITNMCTVELNWSSKLRDNYERKKPCHTTLCAFRCLNSTPQNQILRFQNQIQIFQRNYFFLKNHVTSEHGGGLPPCSEGAISHNVLYYQHLSVDRLTSHFYAHNYFEQYQQKPVPLNQQRDVANSNKIIDNFKL